MTTLTIDQALRIAVERRQSGREAEAESICRQVLAQLPKCAEALNLLGVMAGEGGRSEAAIDFFRRAAAERRGESSFHYNLGRALTDVALLDDAIAAFRRALQAKPDFAAAHSNLLFTLHFHPSYDEHAQRAERAAWNERHADPLRSAIKPHTNDRNPDRPLRIGYVSPDFRDHCQSLFTLPLFSHHDRGRFHVIAYADVTTPGDITTRLQKHCREWRPIAGLSDERVAAMIREDRVDILVDLTMHMAGSRLLVFARKPAPLQVSWLAYPGATGLHAINYRFTDPYLEPAAICLPAIPGDSRSLPETPIPLPDSFWCYQSLEDPRDFPVNALPGHSRNAITFGCFNNFCKVNDAVLALWSEVLRAVPGSRLHLLANPGTPRTRAAESFRRHGIEAGRIEFVAQAPRRDYLRRYGDIDIGLDTFPYNGHTTSLDSFWMGVPVITLVGQTVVGRAGLCQLTNLGLPELIAATPEQFVQIASRLAADRPRLTELRAGLRGRMTRSPLMDAPRFAGNIEAAYREMWRRWCRQGE